jgi:hypothetical protein
MSDNDKPASSAERGKNSDTRNHNFVFDKISANDKLTSSAEREKHTNNSSTAKADMTLEQALAHAQGIAAECKALKYGVGRNTRPYSGVFAKELNSCTQRRPRRRTRKCS